MEVITHVIFDMDGLLLDTEEFCALAQRRILERYGKPFDWSVRAKMLGKTAPEAARVFLDETGLGGVLTPEQFLRDREEMLRHLMPASHREHFELKTRRHGELFSLMHHVVTGDDPEVKVGKPCPDIFLAAMRRFQGNVDLGRVLVFEDSPSGVAAAKSAGMHVVMVPDERLDASFRRGADHVLGSAPLLDFDPAMWGLPPFQEQ